MQPYDENVQGSRWVRSNGETTRAAGPAGARRLEEPSAPVPGRGRSLELTTSEVARRLGVSLGTVRRWADHGHLPAYRTPGGQRRFSAEDVERFVASLERPGARRLR
jgi:excisionase family DNA binding protein